MVRLEGSTLGLLLDGWSRFVAAASTVVLVGRIQWDEVLLDFCRQWRDPKPLMIESVNGGDPPLGIEDQEPFQEVRPWSIHLAAIPLLRQLDGGFLLRGHVPGMTFRFGKSRQRVPSGEGI